MHEAKVEAYIPLGPGPDAIEVIADAIEVIADSDGCQLNIMIDGLCEYRLNIDKFLELKLVELVENDADNVLYKTNLEK